MSGWSGAFTVTDPRLWLAGSLGQPIANAATGQALSAAVPAHPARPLHSSSPDRRRALAQRFPALQRGHQCFVDLCMALVQQGHLGQLVGI